MSHSSRVGAYALAGCMVTSLVVSLAGSALAQGTSAPATSTTSTTTTKKHHHGCHMKKWCHKHHKGGAKTGTAPATPAPSTPAK